MMRVVASVLLVESAVALDVLVCTFSGPEFLARSIRGGMTTWLLGPSPAVDLDDNSREGS